MASIVRRMPAWFRNLIIHYVTEYAFRLTQLGYSDEEAAVKSMKVFKKYIRMIREDYKLGEYYNLRSNGSREVNSSRDNTENMCGTGV